jgi:hypothetical protein
MSADHWPKVFQQLQRPLHPHTEPGMSRAQAKRLLDQAREGAPLSAKTLRKALRASGDLRCEWEGEAQPGPTREHRGEHPRNKGNA